jgi:hypothetical protein
MTPGRPTWPRRPIRRRADHFQIKLTGLHLLHPVVTSRYGNRRGRIMLKSLSPCITNAPTATNHPWFSATASPIATSLSNGQAR